MTTKYKDTVKEIVEAFGSPADYTDREGYTDVFDLRDFQKDFAAALRRIAEESIAAVVPDESTPLDHFEAGEHGAKDAGWNSARAHILEARDKYFGNV